MNDLKTKIKYRLISNLCHNSLAYTSLRQSIKYGEMRDVIDDSVEYLYSIVPKSIANQEIDHIVPCSKIDFDNSDHVKFAYSWVNLQWLEKSKNRAKSKHVYVNKKKVF